MKIKQSFNIGVLRIRDRARSIFADNEAALTIIEVLYIKARSNAIINKTFFILSVVLGFMILAWPLLRAVGLFQAP